jgi:ubiquitin-protein ligase
LKDVQTLLVDESNNKMSSILNTIQQRRITNEFKKIKNAFVKISSGYYTIFFNNCEVSIVLSLNYPMTPPFVWFNKLNFEHEKILSNGAFFIQDLFIPNWRSTISILNIIEMIDNIIIQSNMKYVENTYENALTEYNEKIRELNII